MTTEEDKRGAARAVAQLSIGAVEAVRNIERQLTLRLDSETMRADLRDLRADLEVISRLAVEAVADPGLCSHCGTVVM